MNSDNKNNNKQQQKIYSNWNKFKRNELNVRKWTWILVFFFLLISNLHCSIWRLCATWFLIRYFDICDIHIVCDRLFMYGSILSRPTTIIIILKKFYVIFSLLSLMRSFDSFELSVFILVDCAWMQRDCIAQLNAFNFC